MKKLVVNFYDIISVMEGQWGPYDHFLDLENGEIVLSDGENVLSPQEDKEGYGTFYEPTHGLYPAMLDEMPEKFLEIPLLQSETAAAVEDEFILGLPDPGDRKRLWKESRKRPLNGVLFDCDRRDLKGAWRRFRLARHLRHARAWLRSCGVEPVHTGV